MKKEKVKKKIFFIALVISIASITLAFLKIHHWYYPAVISVWLVFDCLTKSNKTAFSLIINRKYKQFIKLYLALFLFGLTIEIIGQYFLHFWYYPELQTALMLITIPFFYPFILMSFREMYETIRRKIKKALIPTTFLGIIIWEIPNLTSKDWIYTIPWFPEIGGINMLVILGWPILILGSKEIYKKILK